jgi:hypothetical protein
VPVLDEQVIQREGQLPVRGGPVPRVGGLDHDRAVQAHLQPEVFADVRVVPVEPGVREADSAGIRPADRDRYLGLIRHTVVLVLQPQPVPVHGCLDIAVVPHLHGDLRALINLQGRAGDRPVVGEHAQLGAVDVLAHRADPQVKPVPVGKPGHVRAKHLRQSRRLSREQVVLLASSGWSHHAATVSSHPCTPGVIQVETGWRRLRLVNPCRSGQCSLASLMIALQQDVIMSQTERDRPSVLRAARERTAPRSPARSSTPPGAPGDRRGLRSQPARHRPRDQGVILGGVRLRGEP